MVAEISSNLKVFKPISKREKRERERERERANIIRCFPRKYSYFVMRCWY